MTGKDDQSGLPTLKPGDEGYCPRSPPESRGYHVIFANGNMTGDCVYCGAWIA